MIGPAPIQCLYLSPDESGHAGVTLPEHAADRNHSEESKPMNAPATQILPISIVPSYMEDGGGARPTRSARQITTFDEGDTTPTVLGFSELGCAEAPDTALVETAYRIGSARGRALGAVLRGLAQDTPLDRW